MNSTRLRFSFKVLMFTILFFLACGFQTSFWPHIVSFIPSPQIWLIIMIFLLIRWPPLLAIFYIYFLGFCLTQFSDVPLKMIWAPSLLMFAVLWLIKNRVQLSGALFFVLLTLTGSFVFELSTYYFSGLLESIPAQLMFFDRLIQILINFIFCYPLYFFLTAFDRFLFDEDQWKKSAQHSSAEALNYES